MKKKNVVHTYTVEEISGKIYSIFEENFDEKINTDRKTTSLKFKNINYNVLSGAAESYKELKFSVLKEKYPHLESIKEFLTSDKYLGSNVLELHHSNENIKGVDIFKGLVNAFNTISSYIFNLKPEYEGSKEFYPKKISEVIKNKSIYLSSVDSNGGLGESQNNNSNEKYQLSLFDMNWYAFNDNYGTSEEKFFIKNFNRDIKPKFEDKGFKFFLVRNERIPELAIYSFDKGERFELDFLLFIEKEKYDKEENFQVYLEPKGGHLLEEDKWKEKFLKEISKIILLKIIY